MNFDFKKYAISIITCAVIMFVLIANMFVPLKIHADILSDIDNINAFTGGSYGCPYTYNSFPLTNEQYQTFIEKTSGYSNYLIVSYEYKNNQGGTSVSLVYYCANDTIVPTVSPNGNQLIFKSNALGYCRYNFTYHDFNSSTIAGSSNYNHSINVTFTASSSYFYNFFLTETNTYNPDDLEEPSFLDRFWQGFKDMFFKDIGDTANFVFGDDGLTDWVNNLGENYCDYVKTTLGLEDADSDTVNQYLTDIYNNDYSSDIWVNYDNDTINNIKMTTNNLRQFYSNNFSLNSYDETTNTYNYSVKNYNSETNTYPSWYYDNYYFDNSIVYNSNTDLSSVILWLQTIDNDIIAFRVEVDNYLLDIDTNINTLVGAFADFDFNAIVVCLADIDASVNALGGVFAGAICGVFNDFILSLDSIFDDFIIDFGNTIGDSSSSSSDDDVTNETNFNFGDLKLTLRSLFDDMIDDINFRLKIQDLLDDLNFNVTIDNSDDSSIDEPIPDDITLIDFLEACKTIIICKIPLWSQCLELLSPISSVGIDDTSQYLIGNGSNDDDIVTVSLYNDDIGTFKVLPVTHQLFGDLITVESDGVSFGLGFETNNVKDFYGVSFHGFNFDFSYYYYHMRTQLSNFLLFICYINFAWSIVHRVARIFKGSSSNNDNPVE